MTLLAVRPHAVLLHILPTLVLVSISACNNLRDPVRPAPAVRIVNVRTPYSDPLWTPDGQRLFFNHTPLIRIYELYPGTTGLYRDFYYEFANSLAGIWTAGIDGANQHRVFAGGAVGVTELSSDGTHILYESQAQIWRIAVVGDSLDPATAGQVTNSPDGAFGPSISRDGNRLLYYTLFAPTPGVYLWNVATNSSRHIGGVGWIRPDWMPNDSGFVFVGAEVPHWIGLVDTFGVGAVRLHDDAATPQWSPDGQHIAFLARIGVTGTHKLWMMNRDGSDERRLTDEGVLERFSWSPDGKEIAYVRFSAVDTSYINGTIWIVDTATLAKRQVTFNP